MIVYVRKLAVFVITLGSITLAQADPVLRLDLDTGKLLGASGVLVEGTSYDVEFVDGTCQTTYTGCDDIGDFIFGSNDYAIGAQLASNATQALLDQVYVAGSLYDDVAAQTFGCDDQYACVIWTPYAFWVDGVPIFASAVNFSMGYSEDFTGEGSTISQQYDMSVDPRWVYAVWSPTIAAPQTVAIDVKPDSDGNCINLNGHGVIPVAVISDETFDAADIEMGTLSFGGLDVRVRGNKGPLCSLEDANGDGLNDLVCQFQDNPEYWEPGEDAATLTGELQDGTQFQGSDTICIVP